MTLSDIKQVGDRILSLYHQPRLHWLEPLHPKALVAEAEFHKLMKKRKPVPSSSTTGMPPPASPLVILTPAEGTPAAQGTTTQAKPDKVTARTPQTRSPAFRPGLTWHSCEPCCRCLRTRQRQSLAAAQGRLLVGLCSSRV